MQVFRTLPDVGRCLSLSGMRDPTSPAPPSDGLPSARVDVQVLREGRAEQQAPVSTLPATWEPSATEAQLVVPEALAAGFLARYSGTTLRTYRLKLQAFARWLDAPLTALPATLLAWGAPTTHTEVERYRAHLRDDRGLSPASINGHLAAIRSLVRFLRRAQLCGWTLDVSSERVLNYRDTRGPGIAAVRAMLRVAERQADPTKRVRDVAIVRVLTDLALRRGELVGLDVEHVARDEHGAPVALLVRGKGHRERSSLTLPPKAATAVVAWLAVRGFDPGPLFVAVDPGVGRAGRGGQLRAARARLTGEAVGRLLAVLARRAGISAPVRPHGLRHTAITALLDTGAGIREAQRFSRHADPRTLMLYDDNRQDIAGDMARRVSDLI